MGMYHKMTMEDIEASFDRLVSDPSMRSLSAILRIGQEQINSRGKLGKWLNVVFLTGLLSICSVFVAPFLPQQWKPMVQSIQVAAVIICVLCVIALFRVKNVLEKHLAEEAKLRKLILTAAQKIHTAPNFNPGPLSGDLQSTLRESIKANGYGGALEDLLDVH